MKIIVGLLTAIAVLASSTLASDVSSGDGWKGPTLHTMNDARFNHHAVDLILSDELNSIAEYCMNLWKNQFDPNLRPWDLGDVHTLTAEECVMFDADFMGLNFESGHLRTPRQIVDAWIIWGDNNYEFDDPCLTLGYSSDEDRLTESYAQMLWNSSREVGMAIDSVKLNATTGADVFVVLFSPKGRTVSSGPDKWIDYKSNVFPIDLSTPPPGMRCACPAEEQSMSMRRTVSQVQPLCSCWRIQSQITTCSGEANVCNWTTLESAVLGALMLPFLITMPSFRVLNLLNLPLNTK